VEFFLHPFTPLDPNPTLSMPHLSVTKWQIYSILCAVSAERRLENKQGKGRQFEIGPTVVHSFYLYIQLSTQMTPGKATTHSVVFHCGLS